MTGNLRDVAAFVRGKLSAPWSAEAIVDDLSADLILQIREKFDLLEPLVRVRLLIACCLLSTSKRQDLAPAIQLLLQTASADDNEWVRFYGKALVAGDGNINLQQALQAFPEVCK
jgi:hypothetical protein